MAKTTTSSRVKDKYNEKTYAKYLFRVRKDTALHARIEAHKEAGGSVNGFITQTMAAALGVAEQKSQ
jgi:predicted HicB family RNase H-like nuclease